MLGVVFLLLHCRRKVGRLQWRESLKFPEVLYCLAGDLVNPLSSVLVKYLRCLYDFVLHESAQGSEGVGQ